MWLLITKSKASVDYSPPQGKTSVTVTWIGLGDDGVQQKRVAYVEA